LSTSAGFWILYTCPPVAPSSADTPPAAAPVARPPLSHDAGPLDPAFTSGYAPITFAQITPLRSSFEQLRRATPDSLGPAPVPAIEPHIAQPHVVQLSPAGSELVQIIPLPTPRPATLLPTRAVVARTSGVAQQSTRTGLQPNPSDHQTFFEKLFGTAQPSGPALAYAAPEDDILRTSLNDTLVRPLGYDRWTAVYDIAAHIVYLPDGTRLEAHSGLGTKLDDPRSVAERMRGATPPNVYELEVRTQLFHGVRALRLNPVGNGPTYGRAGLLAHTYMLGPRGDSNGCVAFKNYKAFLQAYDAGAVKRLAVVERMN
jgi:hypothetical protein